MPVSKLSLIFISLGITLGVSTICPAQAAKWHTGTPTTLQGTWKRTAHAGLGKNRFSYPEGIKFTQNTLTSFGLGDGLYMKKIKYRKINHHIYTLKGIEAINSQKTYHIQVNQIKHRLKWHITVPQKYQKSSQSTWYKKH